LVAKPILAASALLALSMTSHSLRAETPLERGSYLMTSLVTCGACHTAETPGAPPFAGGRRFSTIAYTAHAANLTPDKEFGLGNWTDEQIVNGIRNGKRPRGSTIGPPMPITAYRGMSDADAAAIAAYLRSLPAVNQKIARSVHRKPLPESYGPPVTSVTAVPESDPIAYGRYLATSLGSCMSCHSRPGEDGPVLKDGLGAGGREFRGAWGLSLAPNLTPSGISHYSDAELKAIITTGQRPDGRKLLPPMPVATYANLRASDLDAIVAFLRSLPKQ
jgi:mono/diheme cytochrome c family protein